MNAVGTPFRPTYEHFNWPLLYILVVVATGVIAGVYTAYDYPNWSTAINATTVIVLSALVVLCFLPAILGLTAYIRIHTPMLQTATKVYRLSRFAPFDLPVISYQVTPEAVAAVAGRLPPAAAESALKSGHRDFSAKCLKLGGLIIPGFFLPPEDYFLIYFPGDLWQTGDNITGDGYFTPKSTRTINHHHIPELWLEELRKQGFKPGKSTLLVTTEPPSSWSDYLRYNVEKVRRYIGDTSHDPVTGGATADAFMMAWLGSEGEKHRIQAELQEAHNEVLDLRRAGAATARRKAELAGGRADMPPNLGAMSERPGSFDT
jgi:hypothetical protein